MSLGAKPLRERDVAAICERKMADFQHKASHLALVHLDPQPYFDAAVDDPDIRFEIETGYLTDLSEELKDPVLLHKGQQLFTCPVLALRVLADEPAEIHRAFVEGVFLRKL